MTVLCDCHRLSYMCHIRFSSIQAAHPPHVLLTHIQAFTLTFLCRIDGLYRTKTSIFDHLSEKKNSMFALRSVRKR